MEARLARQPRWSAQAVIEVAQVRLWNREGPFRISVHLEGVSLVQERVLSDVIEQWRSEDGWQQSWPEGSAADGLNSSDLPDPPPVYEIGGFALEDDQYRQYRIHASDAVLVFHPGPGAGQA